MADKFKDPFSTPVTALKPADWARQLPKVEIPAGFNAPAPSQSSSLSSALKIIKERQQLAALKAEQEAAQRALTPPRIPSFDEVVGDVGALPYEEKQRLYDEYIDEGVQVFKEWNPEIDEFEVDSRLRDENPPPDAPTRSWAELPGDVLAGVGSAVSGMAAAPGQLIAAATGSDLDGFTKAALRVEETISDMASDKVKNAKLLREFENMKRRQENPDIGFIGAVLGDAGTAIRHMDVASFSGVVASLLPIGLVGRATQAIAYAGATARGASAAAARKTASKASMASLVGMNTVLDAGDAAGAVRESLAELSNDEIRDLIGEEHWTDALEETGSVDGARNKIISDGALLGAGIGAMVGFASAVGPGSPSRLMRSWLDNRAAQRALAQSATQTPGRLAAAAGGAGWGGLEGAGVALGGNIGAASVDPSTDLSRGVGEGLGVGAVGLGVTGAALGGGGRGTAPSGSATPDSTSPSPEDIIREGVEPAAETPAPTGQMTVDFAEGPVTFVVDSWGGWQPSDPSTQLTPEMEAFRDDLNTQSQADFETLDEAFRDEVIQTANTLSSLYDSSSHAPGDASPFPRAVALNNQLTAVMGSPNASGFLRSRGGDADVIRLREFARERVEPSQELTTFDQLTESEQAAIEATANEAQQASTVGEIRDIASRPEVSALMGTESGGGENVQALRTLLQANLAMPEPTAAAPEPTAAAPAPIPTPAPEPVGAATPEPAPESDVSSATPIVEGLVRPPTGEEPDFSTLSEGDRAAIESQAAVVGSVRSRFSDIDTPTGEAARSYENFLARSINRLSAGQRTALMNSQGGSPEVQALRNFMRDAGIMQLITDNPSEGWSALVQESTDGITMLRGLVEQGDPAFGEANLQIANWLISIFEDTNIPSPRVEYNPRFNRSRGSYNQAGHNITYGPMTTAGTVVHEMVHAVTARGLATWVNSRSQGSDPFARSNASLLHSLTSQIRQSARANIYAGYNIYEIVAEMVRPEAMAVAAITEVDVSTLPDDARQAYDRLMREGTATEPLTVWEAFKGIVRAAFTALSITPRRDAGITIAQVLESLATQAATDTARTFDARPTQAEPQVAPEPTPEAEPTPEVEPEPTPEVVPEPPPEVDIERVRSQASRLTWPRHTGESVFNPRRNNQRIQFANQFDQMAYLVTDALLRGRRASSPALRRARTLLHHLTDSTGLTPQDIVSYGLHVHNAVSPRVRDLSQTIPSPIARLGEPLPELANLDLGLLGSVSTPELVVGLSQGLNEVEASRTTAVPSWATEVKPGASTAESVRHFKDLVVRLVDSMSNGRLQLVQESNSLFRIRDSDPENPRTYGSLTISNTGSVTTNTTGFERGSGLGSPYYSALYGAVLLSRVRIIHSALTSVNRFRVPLNFFKALMKWSPHLRNPAAAANSFRLSSLASGSAASRIRALSDRVMSQVETNLPTQGELRLNPDGSFDTPMGTMSFDELVESTRPAIEQNANLAGALSRSSLATAGMLRSYIEAQTPQARQEIIQAAADLDSVVLFDATNSVGEPEPFWAAIEPETSDGEVVAEEAFERTETQSDRLDKEAAAGQAAEDSMFGDMSDVAQDMGVRSGRSTFAEVLTDIDEGTPATPSTGLRALGQVRNATQLRSAVSRIFSKVNEVVHDNLEPLTQWTWGILDDNPALRHTVDTVIGSARLAGGRRDFLQQQAQRNGLTDVEAAVGAAAARHGLTDETALRYAGYWLSARWAPVANQRLIDRDASRLAELNRKISRTAEGPERNALVREREEASRDMLRRVRAVNLNQAGVTQHEVPLAGNMNNAQAQAMMRAAEKHLPVETLETIGEAVSRMNAWRLALDIETGKTAPEVAVSFLDMPELLDQFKQLRQAGFNAATLEASTERMDDLATLRNSVAEAVRSDYVPLTGDPMQVLDSDIISSGSSQPNVAADRRMHGRSSMPDEGITASIGQVVKSTTFAGWRPFQEAVKNLYNAMTPAERSKALFGRRTLKRDQVGNIASGIIVRNETGGGAVYSIGDARVLQSIRKQNVEDVSGILRAAANPTKWYAYGVTQLNPLFAPRLLIQDLWERAEVLRAKHLVDRDGNKVNMAPVFWQTIRYSLSPSTLQATFRFASKTDTTNTREDAAIKQIAELGGLSTFPDAFARDRRTFIKRTRGSRSMFKRSLNKVKEVVEIYNRTFDLASSLGAYMALQDAGVSNADAAAATLDTMNFRKTGTAMPVARVGWAFAQPAVTSGANLLGTLYNRRTGEFNWRVGLPRMVGYTLMFLALQGMARGSADEDEGGNVLDQLSPWMRASRFNIQVGDDIVHIPLGFGISRVSNGIANAILSVSTGDQDVGAASAEFVNSVLLPAFSPVEGSSISMTERPSAALLHTFMPTVLQPMLEAAMNRTGYDAPIESEFLSDKTYKSEQGKRNTAEFWKEVAIEIRKATGGRVDVTPESVRHLARSYAVGFSGQLLQYFVENPNLEAQGRQVNNPWAASFVRSPGMGSVMQQAYAKFDELKSLEKAKNYAYENRRTDPAAWREFNASLTSVDRRLMRLYDSWKKQDSEFRKRSAAITRNKKASDAAKDSMRDRLYKSRQKAMVEFVRRVREIEGRPVGDRGALAQRGVL